MIESPELENSDKGMSSSTRLRIAWFSDFSSLDGHLQSLSAYASSLLLPLLIERFDIELFSSSEGSFSGLPVSNFLTAFLRHIDKPFDVFFYQFEDRKESNFVRSHLGLMPGVVWFHDFFLTSDGPEPLLNSPWEDVVRKYNESSLPWPDREAEYTREHPQAFREAGYAFVPIFSSIRDHDEYRRSIRMKCHVEGQRSWYLPVPVAEFTAPSTIAHRVAAFCGTPRIESRAFKLIQALSETRDEWSMIWMLDESEKAEAQSILSEFSFEGCKFVSPRSPENWKKVIGACSCCVHTLFSAFGNTNPYLPMSLMANRSAIVTDFASSSLLPDGVAFKVAAGETEATEIRAILDFLGSGIVPVSSASSYARETFDAEMIAMELALIFDASASALKSAMNKWSELERSARESLVFELLASDREKDSTLFADSFTELRWSAR